MIQIKNVMTVAGESIDLNIPSQHEKKIEANGLLALPALIDPHVHFRTPGMEYKEDWKTAARASIQGGYTQVFDMPNTKPPTITASLLQEKKSLIDDQLKEIGIPLRYQLFFGADKHHLNEIAKVKHDCIGIKVFMGCSTGNLVIDDDDSLAAVFKIAAEENMLVAVHAEDEALLVARKSSYKGPMIYQAHSHIRNIQAATKAIEKAIALSRRYGTRLYVLHVSSDEEIFLIKSAKKEGLPVYAETTPHHLFFDDRLYETLGGKAVVNPPLRNLKDREMLFESIHDKTIDTIGSDHAPHTNEEKSLPYGECPSGMPGIEFILPLLCQARHDGLINLENILALTSKRARDIFHLAPYDDWVLVDLNKSKTISHTYSKCGWSPYMGMRLQGWPVYTILKGQCYDLN